MSQPANDAAQPPLIHTTLGNVPVSSLLYEARWRMTDTVVHFTEIYRTADGCIVRQDSHVYAFGAADAAAAADQPQTKDH